MVRYGSTVRIAVLPRDSNEPLYEIPLTLADTGVAHATIRTSADKVRDWLYKEATFVKKYSDITDAQVLELAKSRGLIPVDTVELPDLYYIGSRSGNTGGHYIEVFEAGVTCSCPGFKNRTHCWASIRINAGENLYSKWVGTREQFYTKRKYVYGE